MPILGLSRSAKTLLLVALLAPQRCCGAAAQGNSTDSWGDGTQELKVVAEQLVDSLSDLTSSLAALTEVQAARGSGGGQLQDGMFPLTADQMNCVQQKALASEEYGRYIYLAALTGTAVLYGQGAETEALLAIPGADQLGSTSIRQVISDYKSWAAATLAACGTPVYVSYGDPSDPFAALPWWASIEVAAIQPLNDTLPGNNSSPGGRRLLFSLGSIFGADTGKHLAAAATGLGMGILGDLAGVVVGDQIVTLCVAGGTALGGPIGAGIGLGVGLIVGTVAAHCVSKVAEENGKDVVKEFISSDENTIEAFNTGAEIGGMLASLKEMGIKRVAGSKLPDLGTEVKEGLERVRDLNKELAPVESKINKWRDYIAKNWEKAEEGNQHVANLIRDYEIRDLPRELGKAKGIVKQAMTELGKTTGKLGRPFSATADKLEELFDKASGGQPEQLATTTQPATTTPQHQPATTTPTPVTTTPQQPTITTTPKPATTTTPKPVSTTPQQPSTQPKTPATTQTPSRCQACTDITDCEKVRFFETVCNSCGRGGARCSDGCCECPRCITIESGSG